MKPKSSSLFPIQRPGPRDLRRERPGTSMVFAQAHNVTHSNTLAGIQFRRELPPNNAFMSILWERNKGPITRNPNRQNLGDVRTREDSRTLSSPETAWRTQNHLPGPTLFSPNSLSLSADLVDSPPGRLALVYSPMRGTTPWDLRRIIRVDLRIYQKKPLSTPPIHAGYPMPAWMSTRD